MVRTSKPFDNLVVPTLFIKEHAARVGTTASMVYLVLLMHADKKGKCYPGRSRISKLLNVNRSTVSKALSTLEGLDLIEIERLNGRVNNYQLKLLAKGKDQSQYATGHQSENAPGYSQNATTPDAKCDGDQSENAPLSNTSRSNNQISDNQASRDACLAALEDLKMNDGLKKHFPQLQKTPWLEISKKLRSFEPDGCYESSHILTLCIACGITHTQVQGIIERSQGSQNRFNYVRGAIYKEARPSGSKEVKGLDEFD